MLNNNLSVSDAIDFGNRTLSDVNIDNYKNEVVWFLSDIINCSNNELKLNQSLLLSDKQLDLFKSYLCERIDGKPFQYILGYADFYGRDFVVNQNTLIPRPETEIIINHLSKIKNKKSMLEIGTGTGCISITAALETKIDRIVSTDISEGALSIAIENAKKYKINKINFINHNFLKDSIKQKFDVIVSNPPYINMHEFKHLDRHIIDYEPKLALTDNNDGLTFYRKFESIANKIMHKKTTMLLEFGGINQLSGVEKIFRNYNIKIHLDLQGDPRIIQINL
tara:strand:- start:385 stop:1224 length:840 start_codon:yes stop_codon:yes gene_type:complete